MLCTLHALPGVATAGASSRPQARGHGTGCALGCGLTLVQDVRNSRGGSAAMQLPRNAAPCTCDHARARVQLRSCRERQVLWCCHCVRLRRTALCVAGALCKYEAWGGPGTANAAGAHSLLGALGVHVTDGHSCILGVCAGPKRHPFSAPAGSD